MPQDTKKTSRGRLLQPPKSQTIRFRIDTAEREGFETAANLSGLSLSAWLRNAAREGAERRLNNAGIRPGWISS